MDEVNEVLDGIVDGEDGEANLNNVVNVGEVLKIQGVGIYMVVQLTSGDKTTCRLISPISGNRWNDNEGNFKKYVKDDKATGSYVLHPQYEILKRWHNVVAWVKDTGGC